MNRTKYPKKSRAGIAPILGTLIGVSILFSAVVPFFLYINQVNNMYDMAVVDMRLFDEQRATEDVSVVAYPKVEEQTIHIFLRNECTIAVTIIRVWITDIDNSGYVYMLNENDLPELPLYITPAEEVVIENIDVSLMGEHLNITVATERGSVFPSSANPLNTSQGWGGVMSYSILIVIEAGTGGRKDYLIEFGNEATGWNGQVEIFGVESYYFASIGVPYDGTYYIRAYNKGVLFFEEEVIVSDTTPSPWVFIPEAE
jgi:hypothetical protein